MYWSCALCGHRRECDVGDMHAGVESEGPRIRGGEQEIGGDRSGVYSRTKKCPIPSGRDYLLSAIDFRNVQSSPRVNVSAYYSLPTLPTPRPLSIVLAPSHKKATRCSTLLL